MKTFGFDLVIYDDKAEFSMEVCKQKDSKSLFSLKEDLRLIHSFQIIHGDIKSDNIMWSSYYEKNVFIDFGISRVLN